MPHNMQLIDSKRIDNLACCIFINANNFLYLDLWEESALINATNRYLVNNGFCVNKPDNI